MAKTKKQKKKVKEKKSVEEKVLEQPNVSVRKLITDKAWQHLSKILEKVKRKDGAPAQLSDRMFIEAMLYVARTSIPWRDMPRCFGRWEAVYARFRRWEENGVWKKLWLHLQEDKYKAAKIIFIDSTTVKAHQHAAGASKKKEDNLHRLLAALGVDSQQKSTPHA
jgi:putative transposase